MHNLSAYNGDAFSLYKDAVERKAEGDSRNRLEAAEATVRSFYEEYNAHFSLNTLRSIPSRRVQSPLYKDLYNMYSFDAEIVKRIKAWLKENNSVTVYGICQQCGIVPFDTMDHILPHTIYPEYAVHARNLIPCCTDCNRRKNNEEILNLYIDVLPEVEYLVMDVTANGDTIDLSFKLDNSHGYVPTALFNKIANHYSRLDLYERMKLVAITKLPVFIAQIKKTYERQGKQCVISDVNEELNDLRRTYGFNYWEVAFQKGLVNSSVFWDYYENGMLK